MAWAKSLSCCPVHSWWIEVGAVRVVVLSATAAEETRVYGVPCMWIPPGAG